MALLHSDKKYSTNMTFQPNDEYDCTYETEFNNIDTGLSFRTDSQSTNSQPDVYLDKSLLSPLTDLLSTNFTDEFIREIFDSDTTPSLAPSYQLDELSFPDYQFDETQLTDPLADPINEVTITTTTSDVKNDDVDIINMAPSEMNSNGYEKLTVYEIENICKQAFDQVSLQATDNSIKQRTMSVEIQPPTNLRPRYKSDGIRQIEKSRTKPMTIELPNFKDLELNPNQEFWLRLSLTTSDGVNLHVNILEYHSNDVQELNDGTVCVLLTHHDKEEGKKKLSRLSIIKTKYEAYEPNLTPYSPSEPDIESQDNKKEEMSVKKAKGIFNQFNMKASRIVCQLLIKENESWYFTDIACETNVMEEKEKQITTKKRSTNSVDSDEEDFVDERPSTSKSRPTKRKKRSN